MKTTLIIIASILAIAAIGCAKVSPKPEKPNKDKEPKKVEVKSNVKEYHYVMTNRVNDKCREVAHVWKTDDGRILAEYYSNKEFDKENGTDSVKVEIDDKALVFADSLLKSWVLSYPDRAGEIQYPVGRDYGQVENMHIVLEDGTVRDANGYLEAWQVRQISKMIRYAVELGKARAPLKKMETHKVADGKWAGKEAVHYKNDYYDLDVVMSGQKIVDIIDLSGKANEERDRRDLLDGIYKSEKGEYAVFGTRYIDWRNPWSGNDPGGYMFSTSDGRYEYDTPTDYITFAEGRMARREYRGRNGEPVCGGALAMPTTWEVKINEKGVSFKETSRDEYADLRPDFGSEGLLTKVAYFNPYIDGPWAIASLRPLNSEMMDYMGSGVISTVMHEMTTRRDKTTGTFTDLEKLNFEMLSGR